MALIELLDIGALFSRHFYGICIRRSARFIQGIKTTLTNQVSTQLPGVDVAMPSIHSTIDWAGHDLGRRVSRCYRCVLLDCGCQCLVLVTWRPVVG